MKSFISFIITIYFSIFHSYSQEILNYSISECLTSCRDVSEVISQEYSNNVLRIKIGAHLNCSVDSNSKVSINLFKDNLDIIIDEYQTINDTSIIISEKDSTIQITPDSTAILKTIEEKVHISVSNSISSCRCFYQINIEISNIKQKPNSILINGLTFLENYERRTTFIIEK